MAGLGDESKPTFVTPPSAPPRLTGFLVPDRCGLLANDFDRIEVLRESLHGSRFVPTIADEPGAGQHQRANCLESGDLLRADNRDLATRPRQSGKRPAQGISSKSRPR